PVTVPETKHDIVSPFGMIFSWLSVHCGLTLLIISPLPFFRRGSRLPWHMKFIAIRHLFFPVCC
ncbi:TPA: hypothetical protein ACIYD4_005802, partial [Escherichia coli]